MLQQARLMNVPVGRPFAPLDAQKGGWMSLSTMLLLTIALAVTLAIAVALAYVPMRLLVSQMARNVRQMIQRQRDRRRIARSTPDRRRL
jgi:hypothetical protein